MKTKSVCILAVFLTLASASILYAENAKKSKRITSYLPKQSDLKQGWIPVNPFWTASGNTLVSLINDKAELYIKNGFKWVVMRNYQNKNKKQIKLEIFKMTNPAGAKTVYKHNATAEGKQIGIGDDSLMAGYYIFFQKDTFYVSLTGSDSEKETIDGLMIIGKAAEKKLQVPDKK